jgi:hypothetical protein
MKKVLIICAVMICSGFLYAQNRVQFGAKAGLNASKLNYEKSTDGDYKASFHVGALAHIHLTKQFALQPEVMYSEQGTTLTEGSNKYQIHLNYINVPVLVQYMTGTGLRLETGPQFGYLLHAANETPGGDVEVNSNYNKFDFAWAVGAGYKFASGFGIDGRYNYGITDVNNVIPTNIQNRVFQFGVFYQFK